MLGSTDVRGRTRLAIMVAIFSMVLASMAVPASAAAPTGDPYGPTSTTPPSSFQPVCDLSVTAGAPGTRVVATVSNVPPGGTVRILFDGEEVGRETAPPAPATFRRSPHAQAEAMATLEIDFVVPDLGPGSYLVSAVGANFTLECSPESDGFGVLAAGEDSDDIVGLPFSGGGDDGGSKGLAFTGLNIFLFVLVALAMILVGRYLVKQARERREARTY